MRHRLQRPTPLLALAVLVVLAAQVAFAQRGRGMMMMDETHRADMQVFQQLFDHRAEITRTITRRSDGVDTLTESANPVVVALLQAHVQAMLSRVEQRRPIHQRDPLFREVFRNADKIEARYERTPGGVRVVETSNDPYVAKLIQAHAEVVSGFIANGRAEMMKDHPVPTP